MEKIDRSCRAMLYGHGKRGTEGPMLIFGEGTPYWAYFTDQLQWLERLTTNPRVGPAGAVTDGPHGCHSQRDGSGMRLGARLVVGHPLKWPRACPRRAVDVKVAARRDAVAYGPP
jgi:hypothetical protein